MADVFYDDIKLATTALTANTTIEGLKNMALSIGFTLKPNDPHRVRIDSISVTFGNGVMLEPNIFKLNTYDNITLAEYANVLPGSKVVLNKYIETPQEMVYILSARNPDDRRPPVPVFASKDSNKVYRYYFDNYTNYHYFRDALAKRHITAEIREYNDAQKDFMDGEMEHENIASLPLN